MCLTVTFPATLQFVEVFCNTRTNVSLFQAVNSERKLYTHVCLGERPSCILTFRLWQVQCSIYKNRDIMSANAYLNNSYIGSTV